MIHLLKLLSIAKHIFNFLPRTIFTTKVFVNVLAAVCFVLLGGSASAQEIVIASGLVEQGYIDTTCPAAMACYYSVHIVDADNGNSARGICAYPNAFCIENVFPYTDSCTVKNGVSGGRGRPVRFTWGGSLSPGETYTVTRWVGGDC